MTRRSVLISTHDLPRAGALRDAFRTGGVRRRARDAGRRADRDGATLLLVLTGGLEPGAESLARAGAGVAPGPGASPWPEDDEVRRPCVPGSTRCSPGRRPPSDVALVGSRPVERRRLRRVTGIVGETDAMRAGARARGPDRARGVDGARHRRVGHRQGAGRPRAPRPVSPAPQAVHRGQRGGALGHAARVRAVRPREGRVHRGHRFPARALRARRRGARSSSTRSARCRSRRRRSSCACSSSGSSIGSAARRSIKVDVRIVAATNQDLRQLVAIGEFRRDLYFRLNVLQHRAAAAPGAPGRHSACWWRRSCARCRSARPRPSRASPPRPWRSCVDYSWPGNVRELRNLVESHGRAGPRPDDPARGHPRRGPSRAQGARLLPVPIPAWSGPATGRCRRTCGRSSSSSSARWSTCGSTWTTCDGSSRRIGASIRARRFRVEAILGRLECGELRPLGRDVVTLGRRIRPLRPGRPRWGRRGASGWSRVQPPRRPTTGSIVFRPGHDHRGDGAEGHPGRPGRGRRESSEGGRAARHRGAHAVPEDLEVRDGGLTGRPRGRPRAVGPPPLSVPGCPPAPGHGPARPAPARGSSSIRRTVHSP